MSPSKARVPCVLRPCLDGTLHSKLLVAMAEGADANVPAPNEGEGEQGAVGCWRPK